MNRTLRNITPAGITVAGDQAGSRLIRHARERSAISQAELARRLHTTRQVVNRWENHIREPSFSSVLAAVGACGWDLVATLALRDDLDRELRKPAHTRGTGSTHPASLEVMSLDVGHGGERRLQGIRSMRQWRAMRRSMSSRHDRRPVKRDRNLAASIATSDQELAVSLQLDAVDDDRSPLT